jgi:hypothetical protein
MDLTFDELEFLSRAHVDGFLTRSGHRIQVVLKYLEECRNRDIPSVVVVLGRRNAAIEINGRQVWKGPVNEATTMASQFAASSTHRT